MTRSRLYLRVQANPGNCSMESELISCHSSLGWSVLKHLTNRTVTVCEVFVVVFVGWDRCFWGLGKVILGRNK